MAANRHSAAAAAAAIYELNEWEWWWDDRTGCVGEIAGDINVDPGTPPPNIEAAAAAAAAAAAVGPNILANVRNGNCDEDGDDADGCNDAGGSGGVVDEWWWLWLWWGWGRPKNGCVCDNEEGNPWVGDNSLPPRLRWWCGWGKWEWFETERAANAAATAAADVGGGYGQQWFNRSR